MHPSGPPPPQGVVVGGSGYLFGPPPPSDGTAPPYAPPAPLQSDAHPDGVPPPAPGQPGYAPPPNPAYPQPGMAVVAAGAPIPMPMAGGYLPGALPPHTAVPMGGAGAPGGVVPSYTVNKYGEARFDYNNSHWRDVWAAVLFLVHLVGMGVLAIYLGVSGLTYQDVQQSMEAVGVDATNSTSPPPPPPPPGSQTAQYSFADWAPQLALAALAATAFAFLWMHLVRLMPRVMLWISLLVGFAMTVVLAGLMFAVGDKTAIIIGAVLVLAALLQLLFLYFIRHRIPFAAALMSAMAHILRMFPSTILVAYFGLLLSLLWMAFWILAVSGAMSMKSPAGWAVLLVLSFYWTMEVMRNVVHVTVAGTVATYYFQRNSMPANPTSKSLGRACTKSFGSICFGSLLVAIIQTVRYILEGVKGSDNEILVCIAECILACIEALVEFFNKYAYIQIAIYGKPFIKAARDTWTMLKAGGLDLIIQDDLTGSVVGCGAFVGGLVAAAVAAWLEWNKDPVLVGATALFAFIAGMFVAAVPLSVFDSAVGTLYVCYAEDPSQLQRDDPALYNRLSARMGELQKREQLHYNAKHQPQSASASKR